MTQLTNSTTVTDASAAAGGASSLPLLTLSATKYDLGRDKAIEAGRSQGELTAGPVLEVLGYHFPTDAHCVAYALPSDRHRATIHMPTAADGDYTRMLWLIVDVDSPEHSKGFGSAGAEVVWRGAFEAALCAIWSRFPGFATYNTKGGARLLWRLSSPFLVHDSASRHKWSQVYSASLRALADAVAQGVPVAATGGGTPAVAIEMAERLIASALDAKVHDFTRWFRLPNVVRENVGPVSSTIGGDLAQGVWDFDRAEVKAALELHRAGGATRAAGVGGAGLAREGGRQSNRDAALWLGGGAGPGDFDWSPYRCPVGAEPEAWFIELCRARWAPNGGTNLLRLAMASRSLGVDSGDATEHAWSYYAPRCSPPWEFDEFARKFSEAGSVDHLPDLVPTPAMVAAHTKAEWDQAKAHEAEAKRADLAAPSGATQNALREARLATRAAEARHREAVAGVSTAKAEALATPPETAGKVKLTDSGLANVLAERHAHELRWCQERRTWLRWDGVCWVIRDGEAVAMQLVFALARELQRDALRDIEDHDRRKRVMSQAMAYENTQRATTVLGALRTVPAMRVAATELDADAPLLNCANGIVDLRTGAITSHASDRLMTKCTGVAYAPGVRSALWDRYLEDLTGGDAALLRYLQRAAGLSLWGYPVEKAFFFLWGVPDSGKSRFLDALRAALGSYAAVAGFDTWLQHTSVGGNRGDLVSLMGSRIVVSSEVRPNAKLDDSELVKAVTGGDTLKAAAKYETEIELRPTFTLWWAANDRPRVRADDSGFWARARVLGCKTAVPKERQDKRLAERWHEPEHAAAILAWLVEGCLDWQRDGLGACSAVEAEGVAYRDSQDPTAEFWADCVEAGDPDSFVARASLWATWQKWVAESGSEAARFVLQRDLYQKAVERFDAREHKRDGIRGIRGIRLTDVQRIAGAAA